MGVVVGQRRTVGTLRGTTTISTFTLPQPYDQARCYTLLTGGREAIGAINGVYLVDFNTGLVERELMDRGEEVWGMAPSPDFRYLLTANNDQIARVWHVDSGQLLVSLFVAGDQWIAWTPQGYYAASLAGESLMGWHLNNGAEALASFYPAGRFHKSLYRPDVIRRLLETGDLQRSLDIANRERKEVSQPVTLKAVLPPNVTITAPEQSQSQQSGEELVVRASGSQPSDKEPITGMRLLINGRPWGATQTVAAASGDQQEQGQPKPSDEPRKSDPASDMGEPKKVELQHVESQWTVKIPPGKYELAIKAETGKSFAVSPPKEIVRSADDAAPTAPKLYVLAIGGPPPTDQAKIAPQSNAASNDQAARAVAQALADSHRAGVGPFGEVVAKTLTGQQATPAAISAELARLQNEATLADTTVIYYAGLESSDAAGQFRLAAASGGGNTAGSFLSGSELKRSLASIHGRLMLMLDTTLDEQHARHNAAEGVCGATSDDTGSHAETASDFLRELLTEDYGVIVLSAERRAEVARQSTRQSSGGLSPFAQAFSEAISGRADDNKDGTVHWRELAKYMNQRVPQLSGSKQRPISERPRGVRSFPLAQPGITTPAAP